MLNTCIHSSGTIAFSHEEFSELADANFSSRLLPWIFGSSDLRDWNCSWVDMSVSMDNLGKRETNRLLKHELSVLLQETIK